MNAKSGEHKAQLPLLGEQVRKWRLNRKMTQADLEATAGLSHNTVSRIECGGVSPRLDTLERICQALSISIEQLQLRAPPQADGIAEGLEAYGEDGRMQELKAALEQVPEPRRTELLNMFFDLIRITAGH